MKTILIGLDAFDPALFEQLSAAGRLPNLTRYTAGDSAVGAYARLRVPDPPQSEVSWTSLATGLNPGGHGLFDFVQRDPATYRPFVSLLPTRQTPWGPQFTAPHSAHTLFDQAAQDGYPATQLWWPATFPARLHSPVRTLPGLGAPDALGLLGVGALLTLPDDPAAAPGKLRRAALQPLGRGRYTAELPGPLGRGGAPAVLPLRLELDDGATGRLTIDGQSQPLTVGRWTPIFSLTFRLGWLARVRVLTRAVLNLVDGAPRLYLLPLQIDPLKTAWHYGAPPAFVRETWRACGPWLTVGWPQDTTGLEEGGMTDDQFWALCEEIAQRREAVLLRELARFREGVLGCVFDSLDRLQHMFLRDRPERVADWYARLDGLIGRIEATLAPHPDAQLLILSDHGFAPFHTKVHLNRWLEQHGDLTARPEAAGRYDGIDWGRTRAYALGLNSLYINRAGREGQGRVPEAEASAVAAELRARLLAWRDDAGRPIVQAVRTQAEAFDGPLASRGPDLVIGYAPGFRASAETGIGNWPAQALEPNRDHWGADHCIDAAAVPGVLFARRALSPQDWPSYHDIPELALGRPIAGRPVAPPPPAAAEDDEALRARMRSLGYL